MAIQISTTTDHGVDLGEAYVKVETFGRDETRVFADVVIYASAQARQEYRAPLRRQHYEFQYVEGGRRCAATSTTS